MGIYDRDYARAGGGGRGGSGIPRPGRLGPSLRGLSFIHWLIIVNVLVFAFDAVCFGRRVLVPVHFGDYLAAGVDPTKEQLIFPSRPTQKPPPGVMGVSGDILRASDRAVVGKREFRYMPPLSAYGHFSTAKAFFAVEVWRFITFQFLHADLTHLLLNMMGLWFFGPIVEQHLRTRKRAAAYYLVCGVFGAVLYLVLNFAGGVIGLRLPGVLISDVYTPLIGASAGVFGVLMAAARVAGNGTMLLFFVIPLKISTGAYLLTAVALFNLLFGGSNAGGDAAHVGGAVAGFFFIRNMHLLRDFFEVLGPKRAVGPRAGRVWTGSTARANERVDAILDKVKERGGVQNLSEEEREILRRATEERRGGA